MTTQELLEKAKAIGGWHVNERGEIRTKNRKLRGSHSCPIAAVFGVTNGKVFDIGDLSYLDGRRIIYSADNDVTEYFDPELRKEMESWCK